MVSPAILPKTSAKSLKRKSCRSLDIIQMTKLTLLGEVLHLLGARDEVLQPPGDLLEAGAVLALGRGRGVRGGGGGQLGQHHGALDLAGDGLPHREQQLRHASANNQGDRNTTICAGKSN